MYRYTFLLFCVKFSFFALEPALGHICYLQLDSERHFDIIAYWNFGVWMIGPTVDKKMDFHVIVRLYKSD